MKSTASRTCQSCGTPVAGEDVPCPACALAGAFATLGLDQKPAASPTHFSPLDLPSTFGTYRVQREIGVGGMGVIYEAEDTLLGRPVALKMLRQVFFASEQDLLRFQSEAELASQLDHPHIVPIHEVGDHDGQPYFTMKVIRGGNLGDLLQNGPIPPRQCAVLMEKIARAVQHAHQRGIMHRDLKPANILIDEAGEPWLTDFGLAKALDVDSGLTFSQTLLGTPDYMAPEQVAGQKGEISTATDVWALGVIFYQMLTGRLPFEGEGHTQVFRQVEKLEPPRPGTIIGRVDRDLETLCLRSLEKSPPQRLGAGELAEELGRWLRGDPIRSRSITGPERLVKWIRRHPYRTAVLVAFLLFVAASGAAITWQWRRAVISEEQALANAEKERTTAYSATLSSALAARERHDFGTARRLLAGISPELRGFDWRLLRGLCRGDERHLFRLGNQEGDEPQCVTVIPGLEQLAILSADGRLHLRDARGGEVRTPRLLPSISEDSEGVHGYDGLTFSPDKQRLAYANGDVLQVLDAETLELLHETTSVSPQFAWLDDHRLLYGFNGSASAPPWPEAGAWILDFENVRSAGEQIPTTPLRSMCAPLAVSPDRRFFVLHRVNTSPSSWARTLHVYRSDVDFEETPEPVYSMPSNEYPGQLALSQSGRYLAFSAGGGLKRSARVLDLSDGALLFNEEFRFTIRSLAIDPREHRLGLVGDDSVVRLYDFTRGSQDLASLNTYDDGIAPIHCQQIRGRGAHAPPEAFASRSAQDGRARFFFGHEQSVGDIVFDGHGSFVTTGSDGTVRQWVDGIPRPSIRIGFQNQFYIMRHPAASVDGRYVLSYGRHAQLCDLTASRSGERNAVLGTTSRQGPLAVFSDGRPVTFEHQTGELIVWKRDAGELREAFRLPEGAPGGHDARSRRGVLSRDENKMAGSLAGKLYSVDFEKRKIRWGIKPGNRMGVHADHDLSPDGKWIASSDYGARITIHPFSNPDEIVATLGETDRGYDTAVAFNRDGRRLYSGNEDGRIRVWDTSTWQELHEQGWLAHRSAVTALAVSHEGSLVATSGGDSLKLFPSDPEPGETYRRERLSFSLEQPANWIQFGLGDDGRDRALLYNVPGRSIEIWESDPALQQESRERPPEEAALPIALVNHGAVLLPSGKVLIAGGGSWANVARSACYLFDPSSHSVSETGAMQESRAIQSAMILLPEGRVLVVGGIGRDGTALASCELYDPVEERWAPAGSLTRSPRTSGELILLSTGKVLLVGGSDRDGVCSACELYDPQTRTWAPTGSLAIGRSATSHVQLADGRVLAVGGLRKWREYPAAEVYDPQTGVWTRTGSPLTNRSHASAVTLKSGEVLIVGGMDDQEHWLTDCELYDPVSGSWRAAPPMPTRRSAFPLTGQLTSLLPNGNVLVAGGITGTDFNIRPENAACHLYDPETDTWSDSQVLATPRSSHRAVLLANGKVVLIGGSTERGPTRSIEVYDPGK